jgi:predicted branched-subunit amino acid permease
MTRTTGQPSRRAVIRDGIGVGLATGAYGVSFGALGVTSGLSVAQTCMLSLLLASGASQFALVGVLSAGGAPVTAVVSALLLGTRNTLYGLRLAPLLQLRGLRRLLGAQLVLDETTAMAVSQRTPQLARVGFWSTGIAVFTAWNVATLGGALGGTAIGDPQDYGLDAAVGAAFLALLWPRLDGSGPWIAATLAVTLALATVPVLTPGLPVLVAGVVALLIARRPPSQEAAETRTEQP